MFGGGKCRPRRSNFEKQEENNMRKYIRHMMRLEAERTGKKPSEFVNAAWNTRQIARVGWRRRRANVAKGTAPKRKWAARIAGVV
jgi:hypothetical protein